MTQPHTITAVPARLTSSRARALAEGNWGRGGTNSSRTNTKGAYYYSCSGHGGYVVDGAALTPEQRTEIEKYVQPQIVQCVVRGDTVDLMENPFSNRAQRYPSRPGQTIVKHPIYFFEEDCDWAVLEKLTPIRRTESLPNPQAYEAEINRVFDLHHGQKQAQARSPFDNDTIEVVM